MIRRRSLTAIIASATLLTLGMPAHCEERGTKEEAIRLVNTAFDHLKKVGETKGYEDFTKDKGAWTKKDLYVFVMDNKGTFLAHGANEKLVGRDMSNMKDASGKAIFQAMLQTAVKGNGWVDYDWAHPQSNKIEGKSSYVRSTPDGKGLIGVGIYR